MSQENNGNAKQLILIEYLKFSDVRARLNVPVAIMMNSIVDHIIKEKLKVELLYFHQCRDFKYMYVKLLLNYTFCKSKSSEYSNGIQL